MASSHLIFLGGYTRTTSKGIHAVRLKTDEDCADLGRRGGVRLSDK